LIDLMELSISGQCNDTFSCGQPRIAAMSSVEIFIGFYFQ